MGTADAVPGVSGGTIALIAGVYERLIGAITAITPQRFLTGVRSLIPVGEGFSIDRARRLLMTVDAGFLIALGTGVATAVVLVTRAVHFANANAPVVLYGVFFGLIAASAVVLLRSLPPESGREIAMGLVGVVIAAVLSGRSTPLSGDGLLVVFVAGAVSVSAMILPGVSGSLLLVILGQYERMVETLKSVMDGLASAVLDGASLPFDQIVVASVFILGGLTGLATISRVIQWALLRARRATLFFLIGLVVGALRAPIAELLGREAVSVSTTSVTAFLGSALVGAIVVLVLDHTAVDLDLAEV
ncbi:DUF368 domain-containing protein [Halococcoides cellulosivorans]|uniref:DUF368 domain-containing protein n=2 Tax=Halococcoides cellulosivorans TaxID=1679096 RepID=A0A2R4X4B9_9EURY|nr:DUF368 domain-containing protein [Halococcoides cellulosivorans]